MKKKEIYKILSDILECPCNYTFNDIPVDMFMTEQDDGKWCEKHCDNKDDYSKCWKRFIKKYKGMKEVIDE